jgi:hypothetical protein
VDNSTNALDALDLTGSAKIVVDQNNGSGGVYVVGGAKTTGAATITTYTDASESKIASSGATKIGHTSSDPFAPGGAAAIPVPSATNCVDIATLPGWKGRYTVPSDYNLPPGCYSANNNTITVGATYTLTFGNYTKDANGLCTGYGVYYFKNVKSFQFGGSSSVVSICNLIYLDQTSGSFQISGAGKQDIEAPTSGPFKGVAYYQAEPGLPLPANFKGQATFKLSGSASLKVYGTVYVPHDSCTLSGASGLMDISGQFICDTINLTGSTTLTMKWNPANVWQPPTP